MAEPQIFKVTYLSQSATTLVRRGSSPVVRSGGRGKTMRAVRELTRDHAGAKQIDLRVMQADGTELVVPFITDGLTKLTLRKGDPLQLTIQGGKIVRIVNEKTGQYADHRPYKAPGCVMLLWLLAIPLSLLFHAAQAADLPKPPKMLDPDGPFTVSRVIDGDTIEIIRDEVPESVRLIGVDTPETVHPTKPVEAFGKEASAFVTDLLEDQDVWLTYQKRDRTDRYGRTLAYVWLKQGKLLVNLEIVKQGYGFAYTKYPFEYMDTFRAYERDAREASRGLWAEP